MSPIKHDHSDLPADNAGPGMPPVKNPVIVTQLAEVWYEDYLAGDEHIPSADWWASLSGMCARSVSYSIQDGRAKRAAAQLEADLATGTRTATAVELKAAHVAAKAFAPTNPPSIADSWRFGLGQMVHTALQEVITKTFPTAVVEMRIEIEDFGSARIDIVIDELDNTLAVAADEEPKPFRTVVELKTINGFGYKVSATEFKGPAEGPRKSAIVQGAVMADAVNADRLVIGYLSLECLSPDIASRNGMDEIGRFAAEWHFTPEQFRPIAEAEHKRVRRIIALVDEGTLVPRHTPEIPAGARIVNPATQQWEVRNEADQIVNTGKTWVCRYCWQRDRCLADGA